MDRILAIWGVSAFPQQVNVRSDVSRNKTSTARMILHAVDSLEAARTDVERSDLKCSVLINVKFHFAEADTVGGETTLHALKDRGAEY